MADTIAVVELPRFGGPEVLRAATRPRPAAGPGQVVVAVRAANVNPTDLAARTGRAAFGAPPLPCVLGWDLAGEVVELGEGVEDLTVGDRVAGMIHWYDAGGRVGAYAQAVAVDADWVVPLPDGLDEVVAATVALNALTAMQGLELLAPAPGSTLLVTGAGGAVGGFAVQLALAAGQRVIAQAGREGGDWLRELGAHEVLARDADLGAVGPVDAVFDGVPLGAPALAAVRDGGALVSTRRLSGEEPGRGVRRRAFLIRSDRAALRRALDAVASGALRTRVDRVLPLAQAAEAHRLVEAGGLHGKVVLAP